MIDEIIMVMVSAVVTAVGFFAVKWMTAIDAMIGGVRHQVDALNTTVMSLEHDHIPLREYVENVNSFKANHALIQERIVAIEGSVESIRLEVDRLSRRVTALDVYSIANDPRR